MYLEWQVRCAIHSVELQAILNELDTAGWTIYTILDAASTHYLIVAHRPKA